MFPQRSQLAGAEKVVELRLNICALDVREGRRHVLTSKVRGRVRCLIVHQDVHQGAVILGVRL